MRPSRRHLRVALQIQQEISLILSRDLKDRRIGFVTVTGVDLSPDLRHAKVFVSAMGREETKRESLEALNHAAGWIRHELGQRIRMKFLPEIVFRTDTSLDYGERIDRLLDGIRDDS
ncbi:MAG: 30S ribosome-binding factor RbfA [Acidobacteria bacterium]|nr:MAG: 30S ribosome-binding factor RbfA [Acidobacteriota bacterium]